MPETMESMIRTLADRAELSDVIGRYTYGMDSRDWDLYRSAWIDGEIYFKANDVNFTPGEVARYHISDWMDAIKALFETMPHSQHLKTPVSFDIRGDEAMVLCILQGKHWMPNKHGGPVQTVVGYYKDDFVRTADGWRMRGCEEVIYWNEGNSHVLDENVKNMYAVLAAVK
ncbi:nuclear transport factor 2 family protein [Sphingomonas sp. Root710]|uniref:nuclear transport factor 2 family protein n=1 Tax=Sphingomonas sp. Root710 TaxID=1736594 RepID=UPI0009E895DF|nr:nuclear transport factor 2 family protein [Sphingomonas sp. Root710]